MLHDGRRIELIGTIGEGGFGQVYLANVHGEAGFSQRLALKVLTASARDQPELVARLRDEARLLGLLDHPNIVRVYDLVEHQGHPAVLMEYVSGLDLHSLAAEGGPLPLRAAVQVCEAVASALVHAWQFESPFTGRPLRVVHRDIKPRNVLLSVHGQVKVLDFGIARGEFDREGQTKDERYGTPAFQPPELYLHDVTGPPHDIFALGLTLASMISPVTHGRWPAGDQAFVRTHAAWREQLELDLGPGRPQQRVLNMVVAMTRFDPARRPTAAQVLRWARETGPELPGPGLVELAEQRVVPAVRRRHSALAEALAQVDTAPSPARMLPAVEHSTMEPLGPPTTVVPPPPEPGLRIVFSPVFFGVLTALVVLVGGLVALGGSVAVYQAWDEAQTSLPTEPPAPVVDTTVIKARPDVAEPDPPPATTTEAPREVTPAAPAVSPPTKTPPPARAPTVTKASSPPPSAAPDPVPRQEALPSVEPSPEPATEEADTPPTARVSFYCEAGGTVTIAGQGTKSMPATFNLPIGRASAVKMRIERDGQVYEPGAFPVISDVLSVAYRCAAVDGGFKIVGG